MAFMGRFIFHVVFQIHATMMILNPMLIADERRAS